MRIISKIYNECGRKAKEKRGSEHWYKAHRKYNPSARASRPRTLYGEIQRRNAMVT